MPTSRGITWRFPQTAFAKLSSAKPREEIDMVYKRNWPLGIRSPFRGPPSMPLTFIAGEETAAVGNRGLWRKNIKCSNPECAPEPTASVKLVANLIQMKRHGAERSIRYARRFAAFEILTVRTRHKGRRIPSPPSLANLLEHKREQRLSPP